jgi:integrase/recombinase XerD
MPNQSTALPSRRPHMDAGALGPMVGQFTDGLIALGHTRFTVSAFYDSARHFADWACRSGIAPYEVNSGMIDQFAQHECLCPGGRRGHLVSRNYVSRVRRFVFFLAENGVIPAFAPPAVGPVMDPRTAEFLEWLRHHRGLSERTIKLRAHVLERLLLALGDDPATYDAGLVRRVIVEEAERGSRASIGTVTTTLRGYLRFLAARDACSPWLYQAVPTVPHWRLSTLPRYLPMADVERLIASCDAATPAGIRDKAILLLLARLGLRAGDVLAMRFGDISWEEGTIRVRGKGRREICLPLPQDAGDALLGYMTRARPNTGYDRIFLRTFAPFRPLSNVAGVVRCGLERAGITNAPCRGARVLRHSAATGMLRAGATLDAIGAILRHRSPDTTVHYAKVDLHMLRPIAQAWLGDVTC